MIDAIQAAPFLSDDERADIFYRNAERFLGSPTRSAQRFGHEPFARWAAKQMPNEASQVTWARAAPAAPGLPVTHPRS